MVVEQQEKLIIAAKKGDQQAFTQLVKVNQHRIRSYIAARVSNAHDVDDLAQDTFILAYKKIAELRHSQALYAWLCSIALNLVRNHYRSFNPTGTGEDSMLDTMVSEQLVTDGELPEISFSLQALYECLAELPEDLKALMHAHYQKNVPIKTLTDTLQVKHSTITMRLHRTRALLRKCIMNKLSRAEHE